jgi:predicted glycogen debranching enzyme
MPEPFIDFGREICGDLAAAEQREWLVTNGLGGFASGTVAGLLTRRYHGLLIAALRPPLGRTLLVAKLEETAEYDAQSFPLSTNRWSVGAIAPRGYLNLERFRLEGTTPVWTFALADALLEKRVWMKQGSNTTYVRYDLVRSSGSLRLTLRALVNYRDYHALTQAGAGRAWRTDIQPVEHGLRVVAFQGATPFYLLSVAAAVEAAEEWYLNLDLAVERFRGLDDHEDHLHAATFTADLTPDNPLTIVLSGEPDADSAHQLQARWAREAMVLDQWQAISRTGAGAPDPSPPWIRQLVLAADQFIVRRPLPADPEACSVIAGYPWFGDWGRDALISLPGLTLSTGQPETARKILQTVARFVDRGMLPNRFPEGAESAEYNTADATLWYFEALRQYYAATRDRKFLRGLFGVLADILEWHVRGTRFNIHVDPTDGLLHAGEAGVQLTWMDAKVGDWVVTPRTGKPVEVNALWYNALLSMAEFARAVEKPPAEYDRMAAQARAGFQRFWSPTMACCLDVIDGPEGDDASLRPNQLLAVSLPNSPLDPEQQRGVVDACARHLLTSCGLRSLAPTHPQYQGRYEGCQRRRDAAYHQGTVWAWWLGPFVTAHLRVYRDAVKAVSFLEPIAHHLKAHGLGSVSEIFDGDPPFTPRGCTAQAWSVAEVLRAWVACHL